MNLENYFQRIGFTGQAQATLDVLQEIHYLHPLAIPFENLTSFLAGKVSLDPGKVFHKLVNEGRGGYCFEQNLLLAQMLGKIGFDVSAHAARVVWQGIDKSQAPRTHMLLKVMIDGKPWIADVGFGGLTMTTPLQLDTGAAQPSSHEDFRITSSDDTYTISAKLGDAWRPMYVFDLSTQYPADYALANFYVSTHPESRFVQNLIVARPFKNGRHVLMNNTYVKYSLDGRKTEKLISGVDELLALLQDNFKLRLEGTVDVQSLQEKLHNPA